MGDLKTQSLVARMHRTGPFTVEVEGSSPVQGETIPRRNAKTADKLVTRPAEGINTIYDIVTWSAKTHGNREALASRTLLKVHKETKKVKKVIDGQVQEVDKEWAYSELSAYSHVSFVEHAATVHEIGAGFRALGFQPKDRVHMFAGTSAHWLSIAHGAMSQSMVLVTAYDTLGEDGLRHSLVSTKAKAIYLEPRLLKTFVKTLAAAKSIKYIILNTTDDSDIRAEDLETIKSQYAHVKVLKYGDLQQLGKDNPVEATPPDREDLCCIMYTSGSSGVPKGVPIKHKAVVASVAGATTVVGPYLGPGDRLIAYLPLAHIFEFVFENACLFWGGSMGYGSIRTLVTSNCRNCKGDIEEYKPTLMVGIPTVWENVKKGIVAQINSRGPVVKNLFWGAMNAKQFLDSRALPGGFIFDKLVLNQIKARLGGNLRFCMNGAAPIAKDTHEFISTAICPLINGYGMTETTAMGALCDPMAWTTDAVGEVPSAIEVKLVDFADAGYFATNKPNPQGEVWIRGEAVMEKYWDDEEATKEAIAPGGWFKTGDIGEFDQHGHLKIIDRKKNLVKTLNGEYIALEKLESVYRSATIVANICVYADIQETHAVAIVVPVETALVAMASDLGVEGYGIGDLVRNPRIQQEILKQLQGAGRKLGLSSMEIIVGVVLSDEEWTPETGMVTATSKLNRKGIFERYQSSIKDAYKAAH